jgi:gamma-glutamylcyclotransferase
MLTFTYFAYGSNMLRERLSARCPSAKVLGRATATGYSLQFCKQSADGSGKATLVQSTKKDAIVHGVLFEIATAERADLDAAEGLGKGYARDDDFRVRSEDGNEVRATTYIGTRLDRSLMPYDWYRALVIAGARQHELPAEWVTAIEKVAAVRDPKPDRPARLNALAVLENAGFAKVLTSA